MEREQHEKMTNSNNIFKTVYKRMASLYEDTNSRSNINRIIKANTTDLM